MPNLDLAVNAGSATVTLVDSGTRIARCRVDDLACSVIAFEDSSGALTGSVSKGCGLCLEAEVFGVSTWECTWEWARVVGSWTGLTCHMASFRVRVAMPALDC